MIPVVESVARRAAHSVSKDVCSSITLVEGHGVEGDAHYGKTVQHRSRLRQFSASPNLRQVHLIHGELHDALRQAGFHVAPGDMGENVTTRGLDLLALPEGARLTLGQSVVVEITGLRNPCKQLDGLQRGLMAATLSRDSEGNLVRKAGVMAIVLQGGIVCVGDLIRVELPAEPHRPLEPV